MSKNVEKTKYLWLSRGESVGQSRQGSDCKDGLDTVELTSTVIWLLCVSRSVRRLQVEGVYMANMEKRGPYIYTWYSAAKRTLAWLGQRCIQPLTRNLLSVHLHTIQVHV